MSPLYPILVFALLFTGLTAAAQSGPEADLQKSFGTLRESARKTAAEASKRKAEAAQNLVTVSIAPAKEPKSQWWEKVLRRNAMFADNARLMSQQFNLPGPLPVRFVECQDANAWYSAEPAPHIDICYQLLRRSAALLKPAVPPEHLTQSVLLSALWTFYHELGHALIHVYDLPTVGKEEDAVDQLSTLILLGSDEGGVQAVQIAAVEFFRTGERAEKDIADASKRGQNLEFPFWDVHSLDKQRFYEMLCLAYGKNPTENADLITEGLLPKERAEGCEYEYQKTDRAWDALLAPHLRQSPAPAAKP